MVQLRINEIQIEPLYRASFIINCCCLQCTMCPDLSSLLNCSLTGYKGGTLQNPSQKLKTLQLSTKGENLFLHQSSKFHHKARAKRKKDREKEVFAVHNVLEACTNGKKSLKSHDFC